MAPQQLRPYQERGLSQVLDAWKQGARSVLMVLPTGGGKTTMFGHLVAQVPTRSLILVHRRELATQATTRLGEFGVDFGVVMAGVLPKPYAKVQVASVPTLIRREAPPASLVIADEAHLSTAASWRAVLDQYPQARILGVTATPWRLSGKPLAGLYDACVVVAKPDELRRAGYLCPYVGFSYKAPDLSGVSKVGDDYNQGEAGAVMSAIVPTVVEEWKRHASHLSTVVFAVTVEHSRKLTAEFRAAGATAEHLDGETPVEQRKAILARVARGETRVLCNVGVAVEGLDIPRLKCCILARPTMSLARAIQMMGRVRRPWEGQTARIHDHAFVIGRHGLPDMDRDYTLGAQREDPPPLRTCPKCLAVYPPGEGCPFCGPTEADAAERQALTEIHDAEQVAFSSGEDPAPEPEQVGPARPVKIDWEKVGRTIEGIFRGSMEESTTWGSRRRYLVEGKRLWSLPGTAMLDRLMAKVREGDGVRVTYQGERDLPDGRRRREFKVQVDRAPDPVQLQREAAMREARRLYVEENLSFKVIGPRLGVNWATVRKWVLKMGVPVRTPEQQARVRGGANRALSEHVQRAVVAHYKAGLSMNAVGKLVGCSEGAVRDCLLRHGIKLRSYAGANAPDPRVVRRAVRLYRALHPTPEIAATLGVHPATVNEWLKAAGVTRRRGETKRLAAEARNADRIKAAVRLYRTGKTLAQVARALRVSPSTVREWLISKNVRMRPAGGAHA